jgi:hypothetical protein
MLNDTSALIFRLALDQPGTATKVVRCIDHSFQTDVLIEGWEYEVRAERDDRYIFSGFDKGFSKTRFEIISNPSKARVRIEHLHFNPAP